MKNVFLGGETPRATHQLDPARIIETADALAQRVERGLPGSTLAGLAAELATIARDTGRRVQEAKKPIVAIRVASATTIVCTLLGLLYFLRNIQSRTEFTSVSEFLGAVDTGFNFLVALAGAMWFLATLEARLKRKVVLDHIQELREFVHVIDATQLYYTPDLYPQDGDASGHRQRFDHTYLLFCTQMLGVICNLAALYTRGEAGDSIMQSAGSVEMFSAALTSKLYGKAEFVRLSAVKD